MSSAPDPPANQVLVSACLAGRACRYDGSASPDDRVAALVAEGRAVLVCPEEAGGLGTPRPAAEILGGDGADVLAGRARVVTRDGADVTAAYLKGAGAALAAAQASGATEAILKARSPSCGKGCVHDGSFSGSTRAGDGVTTALLQINGINVTTGEEPLPDQSDKGDAPPSTAPDGAGTPSDTPNPWVSDSC